MNIDDAASELGVSKKTLKRLIKNGSLNTPDRSGDKRQYVFDNAYITDARQTVENLRQGGFIVKGLLKT